MKLAVLYSKTLLASTLIYWLQISVCWLCFNFGPINCQLIAANFQIQYFNLLIFVLYTGISLLVGYFSYFSLEKKNLPFFCNRLQDKFYMYPVSSLPLEESIEKDLVFRHVFHWISVVHYKINFCSFRCWIKY